MCSYQYNENHSMQTPVFSIFTLLLFVISSLTACQFGKSDQEILYSEVMEIHDNVMPEMGTIHRLKKQLKTIDTTLVKSPTYPIILDHLASLEKADEAMMSWMAEFSNPTEDTNEIEALDYLEKEKIRISEVRDQMQESIDSAKRILLEVKK